MKISVFALTMVFSAALVPSAAFAQVPVTTQPSSVSGATQSGTITTGGSFQQLFSFEQRKGCLIQNTSGDSLSVFLGAGTPTAAASYSITPGSTFQCAALGGVSVDDNIQISGPTTGDSFVFADNK